MKYYINKDRLYKLMLLNGLSINMLAKKSNISPVTIYKMLNKKHAVSARIIKSIADCLNADPLELVQKSEVID